MFCHPNTVRQRLRRLETDTGRPVNNPRDATELFIAVENAPSITKDPVKLAPSGVSLDAVKTRKQHRR